MFFQRENRLGSRGAIYAKTSDFAGIFLRDMDRLFQLGLLLTGTASDAERCLLVALDFCTDGTMVLSQWVPSWTRRSVIKSAIKIMSLTLTSRNHTDNQNFSQGNHEKEIRWGTKHVLDNVCNLPTFDRFVFVMSVLEKFPGRECSVLLNCTARDIFAARIRALRQLASLDETRRA